MVSDTAVFNVGDNAAEIKARCDRQKVCTVIKCTDWSASGAELMYELQASIWTGGDRNITHPMILPFRSACDVRSTPAVRFGRCSRLQNTITVFTYWVGEVQSTDLE